MKKYKKALETLKEMR